MTVRSIKLGLVAVTLAFAAVVGTAAPARADQHLELPAGTACDFGLIIDSIGEQTVIREFRDRSGNLVREIRAGKGSTLIFTNADSGSVVTLQSNGSVRKTTFNPNGTQTVSLAGHNVLILFPSDVPAGPSTILYLGSVVYTVDTQAVFTVESTSGPTRDICAELTASA